MTETTKAKFDEALAGVLGALKKVESSERSMAKKQQEIEQKVAEMAQCRDNPKNVEEAGRVPALQAQIAFLEKERDKAEGKLVSIQRDHGEAFNTGYDFIVPLMAAAGEKAANKYVKLLEPLEREPIRIRQILSNLSVVRGFFGRLQEANGLWAFAEYRVKALQTVAKLFEDYAAMDASGKDAF